MTPELRAELLAFWSQHHAVRAERAEERADQAVCFGRDAQGELCAVSTAVLRVLPRLRQPMYYYRTFLTKSVRGQGHVIPMHNRSRETLQAYNRTLPAPEGLGLLLELESTFLSTYYKRAYVAEADSVFIGYSPRGLQLRVSYFDDAVLLPPTPVPGLPPAG